MAVMLAKDLQFQVFKSVDGPEVTSVHKAWFSFQSVSLVTDSVGGSNDGLTLTKRGIYDPPLKQYRSYKALI